MPSVIRYFIIGVIILFILLVLLFWLNESGPKVIELGNGKIIIPAD